MLPCFLHFFPYSGNCICSLTSGWVGRLFILLQVKVYTVTSTDMLKGVCILCHFRCNNLIKNLRKMSRPLHKLLFCHKSCQMVGLYTFCRTKMLLTTFLNSKKTCNFKNKTGIKSQKPFQILLKGVILLSQLHYITNQAGADKSLGLLHIIFKEASDLLIAHSPCNLIRR